MDEQTWQDEFDIPLISVQAMPDNDVPEVSAHSVKRNTVQDTWDWLWKDTLGRIAPFVAATAIYAKASGKGARGVGWTNEGWKQDLLFGIAAGIPLAGVAAFYRSRVAPGYRLPTPPDQMLQTAFYLGVNAPAEEVFWRGMVQSLTISGLRRARLQERYRQHAGLGSGNRGIRRLPSTWKLELARHRRSHRRRRSLRRRVPRDRQTAISTLAYHTAWIYDGGVPELGRHFPTPACRLETADPKWRQEAGPSLAAPLTCQMEHRQVDDGLQGAGRWQSGKETQHQRGNEAKIEQGNVDA